MCAVQFEAIGDLCEARTLLDDLRSFDPTETADPEFQIAKASKKIELLATLSAQWASEPEAVAILPNDLANTCHRMLEATDAGNFDLLRTAAQQAYDSIDLDREEFVATDEVYELIKRCAELTTDQVLTFRLMADQLLSAQDYKYYEDFANDLCEHRSPRFQEAIKTFGNEFRNLRVLTLVCFFELQLP